MIRSRELAYEFGDMLLWSHLLSFRFCGEQDSRRLASDHPLSFMDATLPLMEE